jgi:hypothetical protein
MFLSEGVVKKCSSKGNITPSKNLRITDLDQFSVHSATQLKVKRDFIYFSLANELSFYLVIYII